MNKMALKYCFICLVLFGFVITANGEMYIWTDENGVKHFSNTMPPPEYLQDATQSGEIKYSDDYYQKREAEQRLKSQEMNEERRQEKERPKIDELQKRKAQQAEIKAQQRNQLRKHSIDKWYGGNGYIRLKDGKLHTPNGLYYPSGTSGNKWYGAGGYIRLKNGKLHTPFGLCYPSQ